MLWQSSRVSSTLQEWVLHFKTKKKVQINMSKNKWLFSLTGKLHSTINTWSMQYFTYYWQNTFTIHIPNLITAAFLLFVRSQFTINAQNVQYLNQCMQGHIWSRTVTHFQMSWDCWKWFDRHKKCVGEVFLHFQLYLNTYAGVSKKKSKGLRSDKQGSHTTFLLCYMLGIIQNISQKSAIMFHSPITHKHTFSTSCETPFKRKSL
jgi:hypothetical protein